MRRIVSFSFALVLGISAGCAMQKPNEKQAMKCEERAITGSHIPSLVCVPADDEDQRRSQDQEEVRRLQRADQSGRSTPR